MSDLQLSRRNQPDPAYILAIDTGSKTGYALFNAGQMLKNGVWNLTPKKDEHHGKRFNSFLDNIKREVELKESRGTVVIAYEEIKFPHRSVAAAAVYHGMVGLLLEYCYRSEITTLAAHTGTIKKIATGKGNARKDEMMEAYTRETDTTPEDDNAADAYWIGRAALTHLGIEYNGICDDIPF